MDSLGAGRCIPQHVLQDVVDPMFAYISSVKHTIYRSRVTVFTILYSQRQSHPIHLISVFPVQSPYNLHCKQFLLYLRLPIAVLTVFHEKLVDDSGGVMLSRPSLLGQHQVPRVPQQPLCQSLPLLLCVLRLILSEDTISRSTNEYTRQSPLRRGKTSKPYRNWLLRNVPPIRAHVYPPGV